jgi:radical SAM-linked protein
VNGRLLFEKTGRSRYISHLDLMRTLRRVFARAGVALRHTEGFNPHPHISIALPLPVGHASVCELMDFETEGGPALEAIPGLLNPKMPEGLRARMAYMPARPISEIKWMEIDMTAQYGEAPPENAVDGLSAYFASGSIVVPKRTKRGVRDIDIVPAMGSVRFSASGPGRITATAVLSASSPVLNPDMLIAAVSRDRPELTPEYVLTTRTEIYDSDMRVFR